MEAQNRESFKGAEPGAIISNYSNSSTFMPQEMRKQSRTLSWYATIFSPIHLTLLMSLVHGLYEFSALAYLYHQKNNLKLTSAQLQNMNGVTTILWCIKPVFGMVVDAAIKKFKKSKYIFVLGCIGKALCLFAFAALNPGKILFIFISLGVTLLFVVESIACDYVLCLASQVESAEGKRHNYTPYYTVFKMGGDILGTYLGGMYFHKMGGSTTFYTGMVFPIVCGVFALLTAEQPQSLPEKDEDKAQWQVLMDMLGQFSTIIILIFAFMVTLQPNFGPYFEYYMIEHFSATPFIVTILRTLPKIFGLTGMLLYSYVWKDMPLKVLYVVMNTSLALIHLSFLLVTKGVIEKMGISPYVVYVGYNSLQAILSEGNFMPLMWLWCAVTPPSIAATSMALFTGVTTISGNLSNYVGGFLNSALKLSDNDYARASYALYIRSSYRLAMAVLICFMPYKKDEKKEGAHDVQISGQPITQSDVVC